MSEEEIDRLKLALAVMSGRSKPKDLQNWECKELGFMFRDYNDKEDQSLWTETYLTKSEIRERSEDIVFDYLTKKETVSG